MWPVGLLRSWVITLSHVWAWPRFVCVVKKWQMLCCDELWEVQKNKCKVCVSIATAVVWDAQCSTRCLSVTLRRNAPEGMCTQGIPCPHLTANLCHRVMMYYIDLKVSVRSDSHLISSLCFCFFWGNWRRRVLLIKIYPVSVFLDFVWSRDSS